MFVISKRNLIIIAVLLITLFTIIFSTTALYGASVNSADVNGVKIVLDAGHGGVDAGVSGVNTAVKESDLNLLVVKKLEKYLTDAGFSVVLTRSSNAGLYGLATKNLKKKDMQKRKEIILEENPTMVISIHMNKYSMPTRRGAQVFYKANDVNGKLLANMVQNSFNSMEEATRSVSALMGDYYILNSTDIPSIIAECGFLSCPEEEALLITDEYQNKIAYAIFRGVIGYLTEASTVTPNYDNAV